MDAYFKADFPNLVNVAAKQTSADDARYNCIAWAFEDNRRWWWPLKHPICYWPNRVPYASEMDAFEALFAERGWQETMDLSYEPLVKKIALYAKFGVPTHAARILETGMWTSKLGENLDLAHDLDDLVGPTYGQVYKVYCLKKAFVQ